MAIKTYLDESGKTCFRVYVNYRDPKNPARRLQRKVSDLKTQDQARREEERLMRECEQELTDRKSQGQSWGELVSRWIEFMEAIQSHRVTEITRLDYLAALKKHTGYWWKRPAKSISRLDVLEVIEQIKAYGGTAGFAARMKNQIHRVFTFGIENRLIEGLERSPAYGIPLKKKETKKPEILNIEQIKTLLARASEVDHSWYPIWAMALLTGMRSGELYALLWSDVDWENQALSVTKSFNCRFKQIKSTKSGDWRTVPISDELTGLLKELKATAGGREHVLPRFRSWNRGYQAQELRAFCLGLGLPSIKFHTLRACFATQLIRNGIAPIHLQKICGWKDLETMQRYIRLAGIEVRGMTNGLKVLPPREVADKVVSLFSLAKT